jgi:minichromosome maintenance protein 10
VTPDSADATLVLGHARDLGLCAVKRKDGAPCGSWTDKRLSEVCEYHVAHAVQRQRAGRAEFSLGCVPAPLRGTRPLI